MLMNKALVALLTLDGQNALDVRALVRALDEAFKAVGLPQDFNSYYDEAMQKLYAKGEADEKVDPGLGIAADWATRCIDPEDMEALEDFFGDS
jgi:hypothetical protein